MARLGENRWGKSAVRISKVHRGADQDDFTDLEVQILLRGDVAPAHLDGDNGAVIPTDTMRNTVYALAQEHLGHDLESFAASLCDHFLAKDRIDSATVSIAEQRWQRVGSHGFSGGGSERRVARVTAGGADSGIWAGVEGLVVLKTTGSAFVGFPKDEYTVLPEAEDRILATSVTATWRYSAVPADTSATWEEARALLLERFFDDWSASVQHQGWMMGQALIDAIPEIDQVELRLPNQHHIPFDLARFGLEYQGTVFQPVAEPYGDIALTVIR